MLSSRWGLFHTLKSCAVATLYQPEMTALRPWALLSHSNVLVKGCEQEALLSVSTLPDRLWHAVAVSQFDQFCACAVVEAGFFLLLAVVW